jgi:predicted Zn-dependent protease
MADHQDPEFVMSQVKLAAAYKAAGEVREAISLLEQTLARSQQTLARSQQTLARSQRALGADHLVTAAVRNNLAAAYPVQRAIPLYEAHPSHEGCGGVNP